MPASECAVKQARNPERSEKEVAGGSSLVTGGPTGVRMSSRASSVVAGGESVVAAGTGQSRSRKQGAAKGPSRESAATLQDELPDAIETAPRGVKRPRRESMRAQGGRPQAQRMPHTSVSVHNLEISLHEKDHSDDDKEVDKGDDAPDKGDDAPDKGDDAPDKEAAATSKKGAKRRPSAATQQPAPKSSKHKAAKPSSDETLRPCDVEEAHPSEEGQTAQGDAEDPKAPQRKGKGKQGKGAAKKRRSPSPASSVASGASGAATSSGAATASVTSSVSAATASAATSVNASTAPSADTSASSVAKGSRGADNLHRRNKKGETPLQIACIKVSFDIPPNWHLLHRWAR